MNVLKDPRVFFAAERTLLAWNRTGLALMMFGFLIERSGLLLDALSGEQQGNHFSLTLWLGTGFVLIGSVTIMRAVRQFRGFISRLDDADIPENYAVHWGAAFSLLIALLGAVLAIGLVLSIH